MISCESNEESLIGDWFIKWNEIHSCDDFLLNNKIQYSESECLEGITNECQYQELIITENSVTNIFIENRDNRIDRDTATFNSSIDNNILSICYKPNECDLFTIELSGDILTLTSVTNEEDEGCVFVSELERIK